jgi:hypothetical protein
MMVELQKAGKQDETLIDPRRMYCVTGAFRKHMLEAVIAFLERHLGVERRGGGLIPTTRYAAPLRGGGWSVRSPGARYR